MVCAHKYCTRLYQAGSQNCEKATNSFVMFICPPVRMEQLGSIERIFTKLDILIFFRKPVKKI